MKESELRIGNFVMAGKNESQIAEIMSNNRTYFQKDFYAVTVIETETNNDIQGLLGFLDPIRLTEEWFLKFGFERGDGDIFYYDKFSILKSPINNCFDFFTADDLIIELRYVHKLQNLMFALTNIELEVKEL